MACACSWACSLDRRRRLEPSNFKKSSMHMQRLMRVASGTPSASLLTVMAPRLVRPSLCIPLARHLSNDSHSKLTNAAEAMVEAPEDEEAIAYSGLAASLPPAKVRATEVVKKRYVAGWASRLVSPLSNSGRHDYNKPVLDGAPEQPPFWNRTHIPKNERNRAARALAQLRNAPKGGKKRPTSRHGPAMRGDMQAQRDSRRFMSSGPAATYYEQLHGLKYDAACLAAAREAVAGRGDGRVSKADAEIILATLTDGPRTNNASGNSITEVEYRTAFRVLHEFNWTSEARKMFVERLSKI